MPFCVGIYQSYQIDSVFPPSIRPLSTMLWSRAVVSRVEYNWLTNRFHVAVRLFSNRSQMTSKCGKNKEVAVMFLPDFDVTCDLLLKRPTETWNLTSFLKYTIGVLAFKCVKGLAPSYLCHRFKTRDCVHDRNTRYKNNLNIPAYKSASGQRTFISFQTHSYPLDLNIYYIESIFIRSFRPWGLAGPSPPPRPDKGELPLSVFPLSGGGCGYT